MYIGGCESAFAARHLIERQMRGDPELKLAKSPLLLWGPYLWAEGTNGRKVDDLVWTRSDFGSDGVHPSNSGRQKVAELLLKFLTADPLYGCAKLNRQTPPSDEPVVPQPRGPIQAHPYSESMVPGADEMTMPVSGPTCIKAQFSKYIDTGSLKSLFESLVNIPRACRSDDFDAIYEIINDAAQAYRGVIPADRWKEPYMPHQELAHEIAEGVKFWGIEEDGCLLAVMGLQPV